MKLIFCSDPLYPRNPDSAYEAEASAAATEGFERLLIDFEKLTAGDTTGAVRRVPTADAEEPALYRGSMLTPEQYGRLYAALRERGLILINSVAAYRHCHYLPESYPLIASHTPRTVSLSVEQWLDRTYREAVLIAFGNSPLIVKDFVKSRKHEWNEACYIPSAADFATVERVVQRFLELQGYQLNEGLVLREYAELKPVGTHPKSNMPLTKEYRRFYGDGQLLLQSEYWQAPAYDEEAPPPHLFADVAQKIESRFFTMDVAQRANGEWLIVELGDAQVAGLPPLVSEAQFYQVLTGFAASSHTTT